MISGILVGLDISINNFLSTISYMILLLPLAFITHIVALIISISKIIKKKDGIGSLFLTIATALIIFYPTVNDISEAGISSDGYIQYNNFKCKDINITSHVPIHIYSYKSGRGGGIMDQITPYFSSTIDMLDNVRKDASITTHTVYPVGSTFKIKRLYGHCSFGNGCYDDFLVKSEYGVFFWLSASDISVDSCSFRYDYSVNNQDLNATDKKEVNIAVEHVKSAPVIPYNSKNDYDEIVDYFNKNSIHNPNKPTVYIYIPKFSYNQKKYIYRYILNSIKKYFPKELPCNISMKTSDINFFMIVNKKLGESTEHKYFYPYHCKKFIETPYGCLDILPSWLKKPYTLNSIIYDDIITKDNIKSIIKKESYAIVLNTKYPNYDHIIRTYNFLEKLKESIGDVPTYRFDSNLEFYFKKGGFYIIDSNQTTKLYGGFYLEEFIKKSKKYFKKDEN